MATITSIIYSCPDSILGDSDSRFCAAYRRWLADQLRREYPEATVIVAAQQCRAEIGLDDDSDPSELLAEVHAFANRCWDNCPRDL